jgi:polar amino acid transport system substrate-binding protein
MRAVPFEYSLVLSQLIEKRRRRARLIGPPRPRANPGFFHRWAVIGLLALASMSFLSPTAFAQDPPAGASDKPLKELVVGTKEAPPFVIRAPDGSWRGLSIALWRHMADELRLPYRIEESKTVDELLSAVDGGKVDVAIAAITVTAARDKRVDFSQPFYSTGLGIAVSVRGANLWNSLQRVFLSFGFLQAIAFLVTLALVVGIVVWALERRRTEHFGGGMRGLGTGVWWSAIAMTQAGASQNAPATLPGRVLAVAWMIASVVTIAVFTAGITSSLTKREIQGSVQSEADLASARVGVVSGSAAEDYLINRRIPHIDYATAGEALKALSNERIDAVVHDKPLISWLVLQDYPTTLRVLDTVISDQRYAMAFPKGSSLRATLEPSLLENVEEDWWRNMLFQYLGKK